MKREEAIRVMRDLARKYNGQEILKIHPRSHRPYLQFRILGWNTNLDAVPGAVSVHALAEPYGRPGVNGRWPRLSRSEVANRFHIPRNALLHRVWGNHDFRLSVGLDYSLTHPENLRVLLEWCLQKYGKNSAGSRHLHRKLCVRLMEELLGSTAERDVSPSWFSELVSKGQLLDGYWEQLRLAVEYCGLEHYERIPTLHGHEEARFMEQLETDEEKRLACGKAGVDFVQVPYWVDLTVEDFLQYINDKYRQVTARVPALWLPDLAVHQ